jgi:hypothetical protein
VYHKIRVTFIDVQALLTGFTSLVEYLYPGFSLEWEIQLWFSNELKKDIKKAKLSMDQMDQVLMKAHPRFIWRASITIHGLKTLEFLADATDMARSFPIYHVIWHRNELKETLRALLRNKRLEMALGQLLVAPFVSLLKKACS